jgi:hypothetical protein
MPKKKPKRRTDPRRQAAARLAAEEARREKHDALVLERTGDPRFVQRVRIPDGYMITPAAQHQQELADALRDQRERFREKFGRDPEPDDPLFFDPDADEPLPADPDKMMTAFIASLPEDTTPRVRAMMEAWVEVGFVITDENQHTFSAAEVELWFRALERRYEAHGITDFDEDPQDGTLSDVVEMTAEALELAAGLVMSSRDLSVADELDARLTDTAGAGADDVSDEPAAAEMLLVVFMGWMIGARDAGVDADAVIAWLHEAFGKDEVMNFFPLMALLAPQTFSERGLDWTVNEMVDEAGDHVIRGAVAVSAAVAATAGSGDAHWLRQFDAQ